jgi:hypothetical protein
LDLSSNSIGPSGAYFVGVLLRRQSMIAGGMSAKCDGWRNKDADTKR